jgi:pyruvate,water dikinase
LDLVETDPAAHKVRDSLEAFLSRFGHRETVSILLPRDPTWSQSPKTVLAVVAMLLGTDSERAPDSTASDSALTRLLGHPLIRATRSAHGVRSLVRKASAAAALREDTHFELSRTMPIVRRAVHELGRRLADNGVLDAADDIWMLALDELRRTGPDAADLGLRGIVERRRTAFAELAGSPLIAPTTLYPRLSSSGIEGVLVSGTGGGGGRVTGSVRIVRRFRDAARGRSTRVLRDEPVVDTAVRPGSCSGRRQRRTRLTCRDCRARIRHSGGDGHRKRHRRADHRHSGASRRCARGRVSGR